MQKQTQQQENDFPVVTPNALPISLVNKISSESRSDFQGTAQSLFHFGLISLFAILNYRFWIEDRLILCFSFMFLEAFCVSFLFCPLHELVHKTAFRTKWINVFLAHFVGLLTFRPPHHYKLYHYAHHRHTGDKNLDPELENSWLDPTLDSLGSYLLYLSAIPFWISRCSTLIRHARGISFINERYIRTKENKSDICLESRIFLFIYFVVVSSLCVWSLQFRDFILVCWILPSIIGQPFLRYYLLAEHTGCKQGSLMHENTRTTITNWIYRRLAWNMSFHSEHHAWPQVPFHMLPHLFEMTNQLSISKSGCDPSGVDGYSSVHFSTIRKFLTKD